VFITALYSFRLFFMVFHGQPRFDTHHGHAPHESPSVVTLPLILLAIPSVLAGYAIGSVVFGDFFADAIYVTGSHDVLAKVGEHYHGVWGFMLHGLQTAPFWLAMMGVFAAWYCYMHKPELPALFNEKLIGMRRILDAKYGLDDFNDKVFAAGSRGLGYWLWRIGDRVLIDGAVVNGSAKTVGLIARWVRHVQSGYLYHYAFAMIIGVWLLLHFYVLG
jgi:NADH-quinone oxidoreductase subunit L